MASARICVPGGSFLQGLAATGLILSHNLGEYNVTAYAGPEKCSFRLKCVDDNETLADTLNIHEKRGITQPGYQIGGDGFWGNNDPDLNKKNIKLEVDYDPKCVTRDTLKMALDSVAKIFFTANIKISYLIDEIINVPDRMNRQDMKSYLARTRDSAGIGRGYIHVLIGSKDEKDASILGGTVCYDDPEFENKDLTVTAHLASGNLDQSGWNEYLDSVGCIIYAKAIPDSLAETFTKVRVLAIVIAHEIGHAIGLQHEEEGDEEKGVMSSRIDIKTGKKRYEDYNYFPKIWKPFDINNRFFINLRKVLGRETVGTRDF